MAARAVARIDNAGNLAILPFDDPQAARHVVFLTEAEMKDSWRLIEPGGARLTKGQAGIALLEHLERTRTLGRVLRALRLSWLVGAIDWVIAMLRAPLSRFVPKRDGPRRFP